MLTRNRHNEAGSVPYRTGRFYSVEGEWWFAIRRGPDQGPYMSKPQAKLGLIEFLNDQFAFEKFLNQNRQWHRDDGNQLA